MGLTRPGLLFPRDLDEWQRWQSRNHRLRHLRDAVLPRRVAPLWLAVRGRSPRVLVGLDAATPTQRASLVRPLEMLPGVDAAILTPTRAPRLLPGRGWTWSQCDGHRPPDVLSGIRAVLTVGHFLPAGALANHWAGQLGAARIVVQHGLLTPHAPPLPPDARFLAFSDADAEFAASGRDDVVCSTVGSQLLWEAALEQAAPPSEGAPVYLGQLHGAELPRGIKGSVAADFCRATGATYRPHPAETDVVSRIQHARWERLGVVVDRSGRPLRELGRPVVSAFSTGILEAAARGLPAWVVFPEAPLWLSEFWERYSMRLWGGPPTPAPPRPEYEPARVIAKRLIELARPLAPSAEPPAPNHLGERS